MYVHVRLLPVMYLQEHVQARHFQILGDNVLYVAASEGVM